MWGPLILPERHSVQGLKAANMDLKDNYDPEQRLNIGIHFFKQCFVQLTKNTPVMGVGPYVWAFPNRFNFTQRSRRAQAGSARLGSRSGANLCALRAAKLNGSEY